MPELLARYEFKYLVTEDQIPHIRATARMFCAPDPFGDDGKYPVNSLYWDTTNWMTAYQTIEGVRNRFKIRIRTYGWGDDEPVFLENKGRVGTSIVKQRALMDRRFVDALCKSEPPPDGGFPAMKASHQEDLIRFRNRIDKLDMRPRLWVGYVREAYGSTVGDGARLTFDTQLQVQEPSVERPYVPDPTAWRPVPLMGPPTILELKFNGAHPMWMFRLTQQLGIKQVSCSKYAQGALITGQLPWSTLERGLRWTAF